MKFNEDLYSKLISSSEDELKVKGSRLSLVDYYRSPVYVVNPDLMDKINYVGLKEFIFDSLIVINEQESFDTSYGKFILAEIELGGSTINITINFNQDRIACITDKSKLKHILESYFDII